MVLLLGAVLDEYAACIILLGVPVDPVVLNVDGAALGHQVAVNVDPARLPVVGVSPIMFEELEAFPKRFEQRLRLTARVRVRDGDHPHVDANRDAGPLSAELDVVQFLNGPLGRYRAMRRGRVRIPVKAAS